MVKSESQKSTSANILGRGVEGMIPCLPLGFVVANGRSVRSPGGNMYVYIIVLFFIKLLEAN
jgi:hypothetical protein